MLMNTDKTERFTTALEAELQTNTEHYCSLTSKTCYNTTAEWDANS